MEYPVCGSVSESYVEASILNDFVNINVVKCKSRVHIDVY